MSVIKEIFDAGNLKITQNWREPVFEDWIWNFWQVKFEFFDTKICLLDKS